MVGRRGKFPPPAEVAAQLEDTHLSDVSGDRSYQYPDPDESEADGLPPYPFFKSTFSYGDPRGGGYPDLPTDKPAHIPDSRIAYDGVDSDADSIDGILTSKAAGPSKSKKAAAKPDVDDSFAENTGLDSLADDTDDSSTQISESESALEDAPAPSQGRGRGRGRGRGASQTASTRGRGAGRGRPRGRGRGRGRKQDAMFADDTPSDQSDSHMKYPAQVKRRRKKKNKVELTGEFKELNAKLTKAWLSQNYRQALEYGLQVIKLNAEVFEVHAMISEILFKLDRPEDAVGALFTGALSSNDPETWWFVVDKFKEIPKSVDSTIEGKLLSCYTAILNLQRGNYQARKARMFHYKKHGSFTRARNECVKLFKADNTDIEVLQQLIDLTTMINEPEIALPLVELFLKNCLEKELPHDTLLTWLLLNDFADFFIFAKRITEGLDWVTRASRWFLGRADETCWDPVDDDREWDLEHEPRRVQLPDFEPDAYPNDSYGYSLPIEVRIKIGLLRMRSGPQYIEEAINHFEYLLYDDITDQEILENHEMLRSVGDAMREADRHADALRFYSPLRQVNGLLSSHDYFMLAICYQGLGNAEGVQDCINEISSGSSAGDTKFQLGLAKLCQAQGNLKKMWKLIVALRRAGKTEHVRRAGLPLEKPYESSADEAPVPKPARAPSLKTPQGQPQTGRWRPLAMRQQDPDPDPVTEAEQTEAQVDPPSDAPEATPAPRPPRKYRARAVIASAKQENLKEPIVRSVFVELQTLEEQMTIPRHESPEWLSLVHELWRDYKSQGRFYSSSTKPFVGTSPSRSNRDLNIPEDSTLMSDIELTWKESDYRGVKLDQWIDKLTEYALGLARLDRATLVWEVIESLRESTVVRLNTSRNLERQRALRTTAVMCALIMQDQNKLCEHLRWFIASFPYQTDAYRLFSALNGVIRGPRTWFNSGPEQKYIARAVHAMDFALLDKKFHNHFNISMMEKARLTVNGAHDGNPRGIVQHDPALLALYGHIMLVAGSCSTALNFYFRAYALAPEDPVLNLCMGIAYLQLAFKRNVDNRQVHVQQGLSLMYRYYDLRTKDDIAIHLQEAEYNIALMFHTLGLLHFAIPSYEKVLELSERIKREASEKMEVDGQTEKDEFVEDFGKEAAYSLQLIFAISGDTVSARKVTRQHLVM